MQIIVDSLLTGYDKIGSGSTILLLHGWGDTRQTFEPLLQDLAGEHTVVALDLPGFGETQSPEEAWDLDAYARFVTAFLEKVGYTKIKAIVGHSNGGAIALRGLATGVLHADSLVLLASAGVRDVYKGRRKLLRMAAKSAKVATKPLPRSLQQKLKRKAYKKIGSDLFVAEHMQETFKRVVTDDTLTDAAKLKLPCLILYGSLDAATPPRFGEMYHQAITGSTLEIVEGADHFLHRSHSRQVLEAMKDFLQ